MHGQTCFLRCWLLTAIYYIGKLLQTHKLYFSKTQMMRRTQISFSKCSQLTDNGALLVSYKVHKVRNITGHYIQYITLHTIHYITSHYITLHFITLHYITLHYITLHYITLHYITLHHITSHYITLHHITSHYITSHYITSHYITLHYLGRACPWTGSRPPQCTTPRSSPSPPAGSRSPRPACRVWDPVHIIDFLFYYLAGIEILHFWNFWGEFLEFYPKKKYFSVMKMEFIKKIS